MRHQVIINEASPVSLQEALEIAHNTPGRQDIVFTVYHGRVEVLSVTYRDWNAIAYALATAGAHFSLIHTR